MRLKDFLRETKPTEGEVGSEEYEKYGRYFTKGNKVRTNVSGSPTLTVLKHVGPQVFMTNGDYYHPTKIRLAEMDEFDDGPEHDHTSPTGTYESHKAEAAELIEKIEELLGIHSETQSETSTAWSHASEMAEVVTKLQEIVDMLSPDREEGGEQEVDHVTESFNVGDAVVAKSITGPRTGKVVKVGTRGKFPAILVQHEFHAGSGKKTTVSYPPEKVTKDSSIAEATNHMGERTQATFTGWKKACKAKDSGVWFDGDVDIAQAMVGPKPYKRGETKSIGEWDGEAGTVYK